jgi:hypothetical protein
MVMKLYLKNIIEWKKENLRIVADWLDISNLPTGVSCYHFAQETPEKVIEGLKKFGIYTIFFVGETQIVEAAALESHISKLKETWPKEGPLTLPIEAEQFRLNFLESKNQVDQLRDMGKVLSLGESFCCIWNLVILAWVLNRKPLLGELIPENYNMIQLATSTLSPADDYYTFWIGKFLPTRIEIYLKKNTNISSYLGAITR